MNTLVNIDVIIVLTYITTIPKNLIFMYEDKRHPVNTWGGFKQTVNAVQYNREQS